MACPKPTPTTAGALGDNAGPLDAAYCAPKLQLPRLDNCFMCCLSDGELFSPSPTDMH
jgi:hypothetical protein